MDIPMIPVHQWLPEWESFIYDPDQRQTKPPEHFFVGSMSAALLARLSDVYRRDDSLSRTEDTGVQRSHDARRSGRIRAYLEGGYPWADLTLRRRADFDHIRKPGWLPTAVVLNISGDLAAQHGRNVHREDRVELIKERNNRAFLRVPDGANDPGWVPQRRAPIEIIDGQHRVFAFLQSPEAEGLLDFELPVVCFIDIDLSWEAYLFWSINITPTKISPSLAYDLFPLLRTQDWLDPSIIDPPSVYRESRAQELTEALWAFEDSPWYRRISMLGRARGMVTQAAWVRSLSLSFLRRRPRTENLPAGFYSAGFMIESGEPLPWNRAQQAAYLVAAWRQIVDTIVSSEPDWALSLGDFADGLDEEVLFGQYSLLSTDQGVRGYLQVLNDLSVRFSDVIPFTDWRRSGAVEATDMVELAEALAELHNSYPEIVGFVSRVADGAASFDWRTFGFPNLDENQRLQQGLYRAGTGYKELHRQLLLHLAAGSDAEIAEQARYLAASRWPEDEE